MKDKKTLNDALLAEVGSTRPDTGKMRVLLESGADANACGSYDITALHTLALKPDESLDAVRLLIEYGADVEAFSLRESTPLAAAVRTGHTGMVEFFLQENADPNIGGELFGAPLLAIAARKKNEKIVMLLLQHNAGTDALDEPDLAVVSAIRRRAERCAQAQEKREKKNADRIHRGMPTHRPLHTAKRISLRPKGAGA
jgi:ankyrin repeat protein